MIRVINRPRQLKITPEMVAIFRELKRLAAACCCPPYDPDGPWREQCSACQLWWQRHEQLYDLVRTPVHQWPCCEPPDRPWGASGPDPNWHPDPDRVALYRALEEQDTKSLA